MRRLAISGVVCLPSLFAAVALADAPLRLNEIRLEQPGADFDEYIEIAGAAGESLAGVSIVVVGDDDFALPGQQNGYVEDVITLSGNVPASGFFLVGEPTLSLATPNLAVALNLEGGDNVTFFLVRGFTGTIGQKLDTNDDGTLDVTPWTSVVASVAVLATDTPNGSKTDYFYSTTTVGPDAGAQPASVWRCANTSQWIVGSIDPLAGVDTPGAANQICVPQGIILSEVRIDQSGTDNDEYFEVKGSPGESLAGLTLITIGDGTALQASGVVESVFSFSTQVIGGDGYFSVAESTWTGAYGSADLVLPGPATANPLNFENSDNVTHILVRGWTGAISTDLDTNDDGVLDVTPWTELVDSIAMTVSPGSAPATGAEWWYGANRVGPDGTFVPGHAFRCEPAGTWQIGPFGNPGQVLADTAGAANSACTTCGPGAGNCHAVHAAPGCVDPTCCNAVCAIDPTCCNTTWDQDCVNQARTSCLQSGTAPALEITEIRMDEPGNTDPNEYIEIKGVPGTSLNGVSLVVVGDGADLDGVFEAVVSLNGLFIPKDGYLLIAESTYTLGTADAVRSLNFENGDTATYFLVFNFLQLVNTDGDADNDCALDGTPWDTTIDSVAVLAADGRCAYSANAAGPNYFGFPPHVVKCASGAWGFGRLDPADPTGFGTPGTPNTVCPPAYACGDTSAPSCYEPHASAGCSDGDCCDAVCRIDVTCCELEWDAACAELALLNCFVPKTAPEAIITEARIDQINSDNDEYFELYGAPDTLLNGLTYIVIGDGGTTQGSGVVETVIGLQGQRIPADGFFLAARSTFTLGGAVADLSITSANDLFENSDNVTHMLVFGFTGTLGQDLDTDDDGTLDVTPWASVNSTLAFIENAAVPPVGTEYAYGTVRVGPDANGFVPSQISFCPGSEEYTIGVFDPTTAPAGSETPGAGVKGCEYETGNPCPSDLDGDGAIGASDLSALLGNWGNAGVGDIDGDGSVGASDLSALLGAWGPCL
jgi:hypothetical protein